MPSTTLAQLTPVLEDPPAVTFLAAQSCARGL